MTALTSVQNPSEKVGKDAETLEAFSLLAICPFCGGPALLTDRSLLFVLAEKSPNPSLLHLCGSLAQLACVEPVRLQAWLTRMTTSPPKDSDQLEVIQENRQLLQLLTTYIVRENR